MFVTDIYLTRDKIENISDTLTQQLFVPNLEASFLHLN